MIKGCQKKIVFLKNTGSKLFDEAYFIIRDSINLDGISDGDMIDEANRIIDECIGENENKRGARSIFLHFVKRSALPFLAGVLASVLTVVLFNLI